MAENRNFTTKDMMGGRGFGPMEAPGMGRGQNSVKMKNPAPPPPRGGFDKAMLSQPDRNKVMSMKEAEFNRRESGRGKGSL